MRLIATYVHVLGSAPLCKANLDFIPWLNRSSITELMHNLSGVAMKTMNHPERKIFEHDDFYFICQRWHNTVVAVVTDTEYPPTVAFKLTQTILDVPSLKTLEHLLEHRQDGCDATSRMNSVMNETMVIIHENVQRCSDVDDIVRQSHMTQGTKAFYSSATKCCQIS